MLFFKYFKMVWVWFEIGLLKFGIFINIKGVLFFSVLLFK